MLGLYSFFIKIIPTPRDQVKTKVAPPRLNGKRVGLFATRSPHRPNPIGLSLCKIDSVNTKTGEIVLSGADLIDGTPILDIKPFIQSYDNPDSKNLKNLEDNPEKNLEKNPETIKSAV